MSKKVNLKAAIGLMKTVEFILTFSVLFIFLFILNFGKLFAFIIAIIAYFIANGVTEWRLTAFKKLTGEQ